MSARISVSVAGGKGSTRSLGRSRTSRTSSAAPGESLPQAINVTIINAPPAVAAPPVKAPKSIVIQTPEISL